MLRMFRGTSGLDAPVRGESAQKTAKRGLVIGELLIAVLLLAVAVSSLTALMYSVTRTPRVRTQAAAECAEKVGTASSKCVASAKSGVKSVLLNGCASRSGSRAEKCHDSLLRAQATDGTIIQSRTDSAALALLPKKQKRAPRPDLGFVR